MSFARLLEEGAFPVALEITPPQRSLPAVLLRRARLLGSYASAINVIQRPARQSSLEASIELLGAGVEPAWHLVTRGRVREEIADDLGTAATAGIRQVLVVAGDHRSDTAGITIREAVALTRGALPGAAIGASLNQYVPDRQAVLKNLFPKLAAGASYVQTQPVFDIESLRPAAEAVKERSPATRIVAMAMPLLSPEDAARMGARLGMPPPRVADSGPEAAWNSFDSVIAALVASPVVDGVAIMTFEMDPPPRTGERIVAALRAAGLSLSP
jgi:5,10-methylenetetrahydrofolate reductase